MNPTTPIRWAAAVLAIGALAGCGAAHSAGGGNAARFHGAEGIKIPAGLREASWWIDPVVHSDDEHPEGPVEVTVPADTLFEVGSSTITPSAEAALKAARASIGGDTILAATLDCHADSTGDPESNLTLSEHRASNLGAWIIAHWQVPAARVAEHGHGDTQPVASNDTPTGRAQNRRCDITLNVRPQG